MLVFFLFWRLGDFWNNKWLIYVITHDNELYWWDFENGPFTGTSKLLWHLYSCNNFVQSKRDSGRLWFGRKFIFTWMFVVILLVILELDTNAFRLWKLKSFSCKMILDFYQVREGIRIDYKTQEEWLDWVRCIIIIASCPYNRWVIRYLHRKLLRFTMFINTNDYCFDNGKALPDFVP